MGGDEYTTFKIKNIIFSDLICYESSLPRYARRFVKKGAEILMIQANDGWLGSWAGPEQHLQQLRMRAIEQGLPVIRSANTGISAVIDPYGKVVNSIPINSEGYVDVELPSGLVETFYSKVGEIIFVISLFIWFLVILVNRKTNRS